MDDLDRLCREMEIQSRQWQPGWWEVPIGKPCHPQDPLLATHLVMAVNVQDAIAKTHEWADGQFQPPSFADFADPTLPQAAAEAQLRACLDTVWTVGDSATFVQPLMIPHVAISQRP